MACEFRALQGIARRLLLPTLGDPTLLAKGGSGGTLKYG